MALYHHRPNLHPDYWDAIVALNVPEAPTELPPPPPPPPRVADEISLTPQIIPVGKWAEGFASDGKHLFVAESGQRTVARIDARTGKITKRFKVARLPTDMVAMEDGRIFALIATDQVIWRHDHSGRSKKISWFATCPEAMSADETTLWVLTLPSCSSESAQLLRVNPTTGKSQASPVLGEWAISMLPFGDNIWVGHARHSALSVINKTTLDVDRRTLNGVETWALATNAEMIYAAGRIEGTGNDGLIVMLDPETKEELVRAELPEMVFEVAADDSHVIAAGRDGIVYIYSADDLTLLRTITLSTGAFDVRALSLQDDQIVLSASMWNGENGAILTLDDWRP